MFPALHISDAFVRTSVQNGTLQYDATITNGSDRPQTAKLDTHLSSWNRRPWRYPKLAERWVTVPAHSTRTVTSPAVVWNLGSGSYWWPNVPYRAGYRAQLHELELDLRTVGDHRDAKWAHHGHAMAPSSALVRFGFRESRQVGSDYELNGVRVNYRGDSLQPADYDSIDNGGPGDAIDTLPGFLTPTRDNGGWPHAVDNYLRLNFSDVRAHQVPWTPYMLDVADERGLMVMDETAIRGSNLRETFVGDGLANAKQHLHDLVLRDRNHPSVLRWSQANEPGGIFGGKPSPIPLPFPVTPPGAGPDSTRPSTRPSLPSTRPARSAPTSPRSTCPTTTTRRSAITTATRRSACSSAPASTPTGSAQTVPRRASPRARADLWPSDNTKQGFTWFGTSAEKMREQGADDIRPYTLLSAWSSLIPGTQTSQMTLEQGGHPIYGEDDLPDPWANPQFQRVQMP